MGIDASGIYLITNLINSKVYIGSAVRLKRRWIEHKNRLRSNTHHNQYLQRAWVKYGEENFKFEIIQHCDKESLAFIETSLIKWFQASDEKFGYNICDEGRNRLGAKHSEETKRKIGAAHKGKKISPEHTEALKKALTGKKRSPEVVMRIADSQRGKTKIRKPRTPEQVQQRIELNRALANKRWSNPERKLILDATNQIQQKG
jgi:group I intron endonuclease